MIVEALLAGCPVVSSDCPSGPAEILNNGQYGLLTPVNDIEQLAAAIVTTLNTVLEPQKLRQRGLEFSLERASDGYHQLFFDNPAIAYPDGASGALTLINPSASAIRHACGSHSTIQSSRCLVPILSMLPISHIRPTINCPA